MSIKTNSVRSRRTQSWNPLSWLRWTVEFFWRWTITRPVRKIGPAIPAFVCMIAISIVALDVTFRGKPRLLMQNLRQLSLAYSNDDQQAAALLIRNLIDDMPERDELHVEYAIVKTKLGRFDEAKGLMESRLKSNGSTRAAYWLATNLMDLSSLQSWTQEHHQQFRSYMSVALGKEDGWSMEERQVTMAKYLIGIQAGKEALGYLVGLVEKHPELALKASILSASTGTLDDAKRYATQAVDHYRSKLKDSPTDLQARASLVQAFVIHNREEEAIEVIEDGKKFGNVEVLNQLLADTLITWSHRLKREHTAEESVASRLELIAEAVKIAPNRPIVMDAVFDVAMEFRTSGNEEVRKKLAATLKSVDPSVLHFVRGTVAIMDGDVDKAISHLRLAESFGPNLPVIYNNLAAALCMKDGGELEEALRFVDLAIQRVPNQPYFRETRGQILAKLGRPLDAIRELEVAMGTEELLPSVLPTIIECYRKIGLKDLENACRSQLQQIESRNKVSVRTNRD